MVEEHQTNKFTDGIKSRVGRVSGNKQTIFNALKELYCFRWNVIFDK